MDIINVPCEGVGFDARSAVAKGKKVFLEENAHQWPGTPAKTREKRLLQAFADCEKAVGEAANTEPAE